MFQRDYILRVVQQAAQAIARALGLISERKLDEAERELQSGYGALGLDPALLGVLDARTWARQLVDDEKIAAAVRLLATEARLRAARGAAPAAMARLRSARALFEQLRTPDERLREELEQCAAAIA